MRHESGEPAVRNGARNAKSLLLSARQAHAGLVQITFHFVPQRCGTERRFDFVGGVALASFFTATRMRREIALAPCAMLDAAPAVWLPFLDVPLASFLLALPFELVRDQRLHTDLLARHYPRFTDVPLDAKRQCDDSASQVRRDAVALMSRLGRASSEVVAPVPVAARVARAVASGRSAHLWFLAKIVHLLDVEQASACPEATSLAGFQNV